MASFSALSQITPIGRRRRRRRGRVAGKFYGWRAKTWKEGVGGGERQRLSSDQGSLRVGPLVCADARRARLWRVLSPKNVLVARGAPRLRTVRRREREFA